MRTRIHCFKQVKTPNDAAIGVNISQLITNGIAAISEKIYAISNMAIRKLQCIPKLHFLTITIITNNGPIITKALIDTGCAKTAISSSLYHEINAKEPTELSENPNIRIQACDGSKHNIAGTTNIKIRIANMKTTNTINVLVIPSLADQFLLGLDYLTSNAVQTMTATHITMTESDQTTITTPFQSIEYKTMSINTLKPKTIVPIQDEYMNTADYHMAYKTLHASGYYQPSISSYVERRNCVTQLENIPEPTYVSDAEFIQQFQIKHLPQTVQKDFTKLAIANRQAFSTHKWDIGKTHLIEMDIQVKTPELRIQKYIPIPMHTRDKVKDILDQFLRLKIIRHCPEPSKYCSNILVVPKKDKDSIRLLFDGRLLNYDTERLPMASISKAEILSQLAGKQHLSSFDFADAFYHIPLSKEAQPLTAFYAHTHALRMCFTRAPQGLKNSPLYLKMLLDKIFLDMTQQVLFYADDLLIATTGTIEEHMSVITEVITRISAAGLKLRPAKILLARTSLEFLGMIFEKNTLHIPDLKLEAFKALPTPNTPKRLKSAICAFAYYRHFVPHFSTLSHELMELASKHHKEFHFTTKHEEQFRDLIKAICENAKTYFPDPNLPFYVQTDASMYCAGGRLYQKQPDNQNEMLIAAVSRTFTKTERNYTIYKKEALALMYTLRAMDFFLRYAPKVILLVDSKALTYIRLAKESSGILLRFSLELSKYEADIIHVPGENNEISDMLSRQHNDIPTITAEIARERKISEKDTIEIIDALTIPKNFSLTKSQLFNLMTGPSPKDDVTTTKPRTSKAKEGIKSIKNTPTTLNKRTIKMPRTTRDRKRPGVVLPTKILTRARSKQQLAKPDGDNKTPDDNLPQQNDQLTTNNTDNISYENLKQILELVDKGFLPAQTFSTMQRQDEEIQNYIQSNKNKITYNNDIAQIKTNQGNKTILPKALLTTLIKNHHFTKPGIHKPTSRIERDIQETYKILQDLKQEIKNIIKKCHICQIYENSDIHKTFQTLPRFTTPRTSWSIDIVTDLPTSDNGFSYVLLAVDDFSNYIIPIPLKTTTAQEMMQALDKYIFTPFGNPIVIRSDEQPGIYNSTEFYTFLTNKNIQLQGTAIASPFSNGRAETHIKQFKHAARKYFYQHKNILQWDEHISIISTAINESVNTFNHSPEEIMFGANRHKNIELIPNDLPDENIIQNILERANNIRTKYNLAKVNKETKNATFRNQNAAITIYKPGELILHRQLQVSTGTATKWKPLFNGPYIINKINKDARTAVCQHIITGKLIKTHFNNMTKYQNDDEAASYLPRPTLTQNS